MASKAEKADAAMNEIWREWFQFYTKHFRGDGIAISAADQIAFYEIAQPIMRELAGNEDDLVRAALKYGRDCVMESFEHVKGADDQVMADARLQAIDAALGGHG